LNPLFSLVIVFILITPPVGLAYRSILYGDADVIIAGGAEKASTPLGISGFSAARALSKRNDNPSKASRPWDKDRDGFVLGDGAGALVRWCWKNMSMQKFVEQKSMVKLLVLV